MSPFGTIDCRGHAKVAIVRAQPGVTLVELMVVMAILAILVTLLLPAVMAARSASQRSACDNNIRQINLGLEFYRDATRGFFPLAYHDERPSGWAIAILPYVEDAGLSERFDYGQPPTSPHNLEIARGNLPNLYVCPATPDVASTLAGVGVCNYVVVIDPAKPADPARRRFQWYVKDAAESSQFPWCTSPEVSRENDRYPPPHPSAYSLFGLD